MRIQTCEECSQNRDSPCCVQVFQILLTETARLTVAGNLTLLAYILFCVTFFFVYTKEKSSEVNASVKH